MSRSLSDSDPFIISKPSSSSSSSSSTSSFATITTPPSNPTSPSTPVPDPDSIADPDPISDTISIDSLPDSPSQSDDITTSSSSSSSGDDIEESDAEREWKESLQQIELLLTMVLVPYMGKYFGRRCAYWGWAKFMEWKYPVEVVITSPTTFKIAGAVEAAASL